MSEKEHPLRQAIDPEDYFDISQALLSLVDVYPGTTEGNIVRHASQETGFRVTAIAGQYALLSEAKMIDHKAQPPSAKGAYITDMGRTMLTVLSTPAEAL